MAGQMLCFVISELLESKARNRLTHREAGTSKRLIVILLHFFWYDLEDIGFALGTDQQTGIWQTQVVVLSWPVTR